MVIGHLPSNSAPLSSEMAVCADRNPAIALLMCESLHLVKGVKVSMGGEF